MNTQKAAERLRGRKKDIVEIFKRMWDDNTKLAPNYKAFLTILATSGLVGENIYKEKPTYQNLRSFLKKASNHIENDTEGYIQLFEDAFTSLVIKVYDPKKDTKENIQNMYYYINRARFDGLYFILESIRQ